MEIYTLDGLLRRTEVVDRFESLVWTERWTSYGDFELHIRSTLQNRTNFMVGTKLCLNDSYRVMTVETVEDNTDAEGKETLKVTGRSLEAILEDRIAKNTMSNLTTDPKWIITDTPANVAREMFDHICRPPGGLDTKDVIPFITAGNIFPEDTLLESIDTITWQEPPMSLYKAIQSVCIPYDLGFRLIRDYNTGLLYFNIYAGNDRTTRQSTLSPIVFSVSLDEIQNVTEFNSIMASKNVAYVFSEDGVEVVYGEDVDPDVQGFDRRVLNVDASGYPLSELTQIGTEALLKSRGVSIFDGEVNEYTKYTYGIDYELGDLVEMRNKDGIITYKRVTEQIFVSDAAGDKSYPTLALDVFAGTNMWSEFNNNTIVWSDLTTEFWEDM